MASQSNSFINAIFPVLFLGSAASLQLISSTAYFKNKTDWTIIGLSFILTAGVYILNRTFDKEDMFNNLARWQFFNGKGYRYIFWVALSFISLTLPTIISIINHKLQIALIFALFSVLGLFYSVKIIPVIANGSIKWTCIKEIPVMKSLIVCFIWGSGALLIAVVSGNTDFFRTDVIIIFLSLFISSFNSTITSDVRDIEGDLIRNTRTIPVLIGPEMTLKLLTGVNLFAITSALVLFIYGLITFKLCLFFCVVIFWAGISSLPQYFLNKKIHRTVMEILVDSESIVSAICLGILSFH